MKEKNSNASTFIRDLLVKLLLIVIFIFLLMKLIPMPDMTAFKDSVFSNNINSMKDAAKSYYTTERMPSETGKSSKMTLQEMLDQNLLLPFTDKDGNACDTKKSYVKVTKGDTEYELKVSLTCNGETKYVIEKIGCYDFCPSGTCKEEVKTKTDDNGKITVVNDNGTYITEYEYTRNLSDESWKTGDWTVTKLNETDDIKLVDTKTQYTGQKKVDENTTLYEEVSYGTNSYWETDTNWTTEEKHNDEDILVETRTLYTGDKKVEAGTKRYEYIKYGTRGNWTYDENWTEEVKPETENLQKWQERQIYTGQKENVTEEDKYRYIKIGEKVTWTQTGWTETEALETEDIKVLDVRYTVTKEVDGQSITCTNFQVDQNWYTSVPSDTSTRRYVSSPVYSKQEVVDWELVDSSYSSIGNTMPTYDGDYRYDFLSKETTTCTKNCGGRSEVDIYYYRVYKAKYATKYQYEYCVPQTTTSKVTDTRLVSNLKEYTDKGYKLVKVEWNYNVRSTEEYIEDVLWTDHELAADEIPAGYEFTYKTTVKTTTYEDLNDWVLEKIDLGEYTHNIITKIQYRYKYNNPERYVIDRMWSESNVAPEGYEPTGNEETTINVTYEPLNRWVENLEDLGEYTYHIQTVKNYKYKHLVTERYIKDTKWTTEKHADEGYELTGNEKNTSNTTYISLGRWVDSKAELGEYTYNIETRTLYKYKTRTTNNTSETIWARSNPGNGFEPTGRSRTRLVGNTGNVQK